MPHYNKGNTVSQWVEEMKALPKAGGASDTPRSSAPQVRI